MAVEPKLSDSAIESLMEIPHPTKETGDSIYGQTKVFPDYQAEPGESYLGMVHGLVHESSVSFVAVLMAIRAQKKGYGHHPAVLRVLVTDSELGEDPRDVLLDGGGSHSERLADAGIGLPRGHEYKHLALSRRQLVEL